jgi:Leu/Phe-tRNA-protein transferase
MESIEMVRADVFFAEKMLRKASKIAIETISKELRQKGRNIKR